LTSLPDAVERFVAAVSVLAENAVVNSDVAGPVLGIHDEDSGWPDGDVVDVGASAPRPPDVVQDVESVDPELLELGTDGLFAQVAAVPHLGRALDAVRALVEQLRLGAQALCVAAPPPRLLVR
jgi:hypothetical protein